MVGKKWEVKDRKKTLISRLYANIISDQIGDNK